MLFWIRAAFFFTIFMQAKYHSSAIKLSTMKKIYTLSLLLILSPTLFAGQIDKATAKTVARNFYYERINQFEPIAHSIVKIN